MLALASLLVLAVLPRVSILVTPKAVLSGDALRLECRIPRHPENRHLVYGILDLSESYRQINGEHDRVIHDLIITNVPCQTRLEAYCALTDAHGEIHLARQSVPVLGCSESL